MIAIARVCHQGWAERVLAAGSWLSAVCPAPAALAAVARHVTIADTPVYAMVGGAAVLASVFKAPLTATLLLFELTRGYELVLPLLAAAGTGPLVVEWAHRRERRRKRALNAIDTAS